MKRFISPIVCFFLLISNVAFTEEKLDRSQIKELCNLTMLNIYNDILFMKSKYPGLKKFNKDSLSKDENGIYTIEYDSKEQIAGTSMTDRSFAFGLSLIGINDTKYYRERGSRKRAFEFGFPLLGIKFQGYVRKGLRSKEFDIQASVKKNGKLLLLEQDKYLPLQIKLEANKEVFKVGEEISFDVTLKNRSDKSYRVKDLDSTSLFFVYGDNTTWGAKEMDANKVSSDRPILLRPGRSIKKTFSGTGFDTANIFEIMGFYTMTFEGANPVNLLKIQVQE